MKIAYFVDSFPKLSETFILNQIDEFLDHGHEITIFPQVCSGETKYHRLVEEHRLLEKTHFPPKTTRKPSSVARFYFRLINLKLSRWKQVSRLRSTFHTYKISASWRRAFSLAEPLFNYGGEFDVLLAHFGPNGLRASWCRDAGLIKGPLVTVFHGYDLTVFLRNREDSVYDPLFKNGELFLPISSFWRDRLQLLGCPPSKIKVHHVGIDCDYFSFKPRTREVDKPTILLSVARLVEKKGIEIALHAFSRLVDSGLNVEYRIIGDGPLLESLQQFVLKKGLGQYVKFLGARTSDELVVELNRAHVFLAPSVTSQTGDMEGIPTVLMEAMAVGMPVVSSLHSGIPELVEDGISGKLVKERDVVGLARALKELVADVEHWATLGAAGRRKVLQEFNIKSLNGQLVSLFELLR